MSRCGRLGCPASALMAASCSLMRVSEMLPFVVMWTTSAELVLTVKSGITNGLADIVDSAGK